MRATSSAMPSRRGQLVQGLLVMMVESMSAIRTRLRRPSAAGCAAMSSGAPSKRTASA